MRPVELAVLFAEAHEHHSAGRLGQAEAIYRRILAVEPRQPRALHLLGVIAYQTQHFAEAVQFIQQAIALEPNIASYYNNLGNALKELERLSEAEAAYRQALHLKSRYPGALANLAGLISRSQPQAALKLYKQALRMDPNLLEAHLGMAGIWREQGELDKAQACLQEALRLSPQEARSHFEMGQLQRQRGDSEAAIRSYQQAIKLKPDDWSAINNLGATLQSKGLIDQSMGFFQRVLSHTPEHAEANFNLGMSLEAKGRLSQAVSCYQKALSQEPPNAAQVCCHLTHARLLMADWRDYDNHLQELLQQVEAHLQSDRRLALPPLTLNALPLSNAFRAAIARHQAGVISALMAATKRKCAFTHPRCQPERLRIGYVSPDFRAHAVGHLIHSLFAQHDRRKVEVFAYGLTPVADDINRQVRAGCDAYLDISDFTPEQGARRIHADGIHILIDLAGHTTFSRPAIFALQPAPLQAHHLGYMDSMGADFLPYMIADDQAVTPEIAEQLSEAVVSMPDSYFIASPLEIAARTPSRGEAGLPETGAVFCCFNQYYKIDPAVFEAWMNILRGVPGSVLWLQKGDSPEGAGNLRREAGQRGIDPSRLLFAEKLPMPEYLARYRLVDLFLDTFVYNAGSTAVMALWAGLPVLTRPGGSILSRMGSSIVRAAGLPELVCDRTEEYIERAVHFAAQPRELADLRERLAQERDDLPLFNVSRFARNLEEAYRLMWDDYLAGVPPRPIQVRRVEE